VVHSVLLVGVPRGGTTWVGQVLGHTAGAVYVHEPDGTHDPYAFRAKLTQFNQPMIDADAPRAAAPELAALFDGALAGGTTTGSWRDQLARRLWSRVTDDEKMTARRTGKQSPRLRIALAAAQPRGPAAPNVEHVVVKTVNAAFCAEWIVRHCSPSSVGIISRHPLNVLASWRDFEWTPPYGPQYRAMRVRAHDRWGVELPPPDAPPMVRAAAVAGALGYALHEALQRHPDWIDISHDDVCVDASARFPAVAQQLGLEWNADAAAHVAGADRPGEGFATQRVTADQPDRWRTRLDADEIAAATDVLARFPGAPWLAQLD
jgi:hypothetical protein